MNRTRAAVFHEHGDPVAVLRVEEQTLPEPGPRQVLVRMSFAPINPADLNLIEGTYPSNRPLPAVAGNEGAGVVIARGSEVRSLEAGAQVIAPMGMGTWREAFVADESAVIPLPPGLSDQQAATLRVNPATALRMLRDFEPLRAGDWVIQNAANSAVGRCVIGIAKHSGLRTVNVVRRADLIDELTAEGADVVLCNHEKLADEVRDVTAGGPIRLGLNAVGGDSAVRLAECIAPGGTLVTYGAMSRQPLRIPNGLLIFRDVRFRGFWVSRWYESAGGEARAAMIDELAGLVRSGAISTKIERIYPLDEAREAVAHARGGNRSGKILLTLGGRW